MLNNIGYYYCMLCYFIIFNSMLAPLPSFIPRLLSLHNRPVDDYIEGKEEVFLKGVATEMKAEEMDQDLLVGIVFQKRL
jgi:hypothetical protein